MVGGVGNQLKKSFIARGVRCEMELGYGMCGMAGPATRLLGYLFRDGRSLAFIAMNPVRFTENKTVENIRIEFRGEKARIRWDERSAADKS